MAASSPAGRNTLTFTTPLDLAPGEELYVEWSKRIVKSTGLPSEHKISRQLVPTGTGYRKISAVDVGADLVHPLSVPDDGDDGDDEPLDANDD